MFHSFPRSTWERTFTALCVVLLYSELIMRTLLAVLLSTLLVTPALAAGKKDKGQRDATAALQKKLSKSDLPADVREKARKAIAEHGPKVREAQAAVADDQDFHG